MKRSIITLLVVAALAAPMAACTATDSEIYTCLNDGSPVYDVPANHPVSFPAVALVLANGTTIDARGESFFNDELDSGGWSQGMKFHARAGSRDGLCLLGGTIATHFDPENTSWETWHRITGLHVEVNNFTVVGTTIRNEGDGIAFVNAANWKIIGVGVEGGGVLQGGYVHDDCVENDGMAAGSIEDSKFDGCNIFLSSDSGGFGAANTVRITDSLVRLAPYRNNYNTVKYGENTQGGFFKFRAVDPVDGSSPPKLVVRNTVFRADQRGVFGGNVNGFLGLPPGTDCDNVMLVGTEVWRATDVASWRDQCTNLTFGTAADWDARVRDWDLAHPAS